MIQFERRFKKMYRGPIGLVLAVSCFFFLIFQFSKPNLILGNIFFGKAPSIYNLTLSQHLFQMAAYPHTGKSAEYSHYQLSRTYFIQGRLNKAEYEANQELLLYPENKRTFYILGLTYGYMNREEEAIKNFQKFIEWNPDTWAARNDKAWLEFRIGRLDDALKTMQPVSHLTDNPWVQNTYGVLLMNKGDYLAAEKALKEAKKVADSLLEESWGDAYPGNDPRIYAAGLGAMRESIQYNLKLLSEKKNIVNKG